MDNTLWKSVHDSGFEFEVSRDGRVRTKAFTSTYTRNGKTIVFNGKAIECSPWIDSNGYLTIAIRRNGNRKKFLVHRLIARAFIPGEFAGATVDHIDGNRLNNTVSNLEWVTRSENTKRQLRDGRGSPSGERNAAAKLLDDDIPVILYLVRRNRLVSDIATMFGVSASLIYKIVDGTKRKARTAT